MQNENETNACLQLSKQESKEESSFSDRLEGVPTSPIHVKHEEEPTAPSMDMVDKESHPSLKPTVSIKTEPCKMEALVSSVEASINDGTVVYGISIGDLKDESNGEQIGTSELEAAKDVTASKYPCTLKVSGVQAGMGLFPPVPPIPAEVMLRRLRSQSALDLASVVQFGSTVRVTVDQQPIMTAPQALGYRGRGTCFSPAATPASRGVKKTPPSHVPIVIFMRDGVCGDSAQTAHVF